MLGQGKPFACEMFFFVSVSRKEAEELELPGKQQGFSFIVFSSDVFSNFSSVIFAVYRICVGECSFYVLVFYWLGAF